MSISRAESGAGQFPIPRRPELIQGLGEGALHNASVPTEPTLGPPPDVHHLTAEATPPAAPTTEHPETLRPSSERPILLEDYRRFMTQRRGLHLTDIQPHQYKPVAEASVSFVAAKLREINERLAIQKPPKKPIRGLFPHVIHELAGFYDKQSHWSPARQENFRQTYWDVNLGTADRFKDKVAELQIIGSLMQHLEHYESTAGEHSGIIDAFNDVRAAYGSVIRKKFGEPVAQH